MLEKSLWIVSNGMPKDDKIDQADCAVGSS